MWKCVRVVCAMVVNSALLACGGSASRPVEGLLVQPLGAQGTAQDVRPGVGILPFVNGGSFGDDPADYDRLQFGVQQLLMTELTFGSDLRVVERSALKELMAEQDIPADRVDAGTAARMGRIVGAKYMILGGFVDIQGDFRLDARIVDTETTEILHARRVRGSKDDLFDLLMDLAEQLADAADFPELENRPEPVPSGDTPSYLALKRYSVVVRLQDEGRMEEAEALLEPLKAEFPGIVRYAQALEQTG